MVARQLCLTDIHVCLLKATFVVAVMVVIVVVIVCLGAWSVYLPFLLSVHLHVDDDDEVMLNVLRCQLTY